jgi:Arylsulfotransferase (ASST)
MMGRGVVACALVIGTGACSGNNLAQSASTPRVVTATASANPHNSLSANVVFKTEDADSARLMYLGENQPLDSTPYVTVAGRTDTLTAVGLHPSTTYHAVLQVGGALGTSRSDTLTFTTGALPELLQHISVSATGSGGPGLTLTSVQVGGSTVVAFAFDSAGGIRWYREFPGTESVSGDLKQQPNGHFTLYRGLSFGSQKTPGEYVEFTASGDSLRAITVPVPRYIDNHELLLTTGDDGQERLHFFTYDHRTIDLTPAGVPTTVSVAGHQLVRMRADGTKEFEWNAWDHVAIDEFIEPPKPDPANPGEPDYDHPNSLGFDHDGNYIVSFRHLGQINNIDSHTGALIWRLGGVKNQFTFVNDPFGGFSAQHSARILPNGHLLLYDNGTRHPTPESRAVEYVLDTAAKTATEVWEFRHVPPIYTPFVGLVQRLQSGNTLVAFAQAGHVSEVGPDQAVKWEADIKVDGQPAFCYRLSRIASLYRYTTP